jgi:hypothetical protein
LCLKNKFLGKCCTGGDGSISDYPCCTCEYWDYYHPDDQYDF